MFRHLHGLLPTQDRVNRLGGNRGSRAPGVCRCCSPDTADSLHHTYFECSFTSAASTALLACMQQVVPGITTTACLYLDIDTHPQTELAVVTLLAASFKAIWESCKEQKPLTTHRLKAMLDVRCHALSHSRGRLKEAGTALQHILHLFPP